MPSLVSAKVGYGESHKIVGSAAELGDWNVDSAPHMSWSEGDFWTLDLDVPVGTELEFKVCPSVLACCLQGTQGVACRTQCLKTRKLRKARQCRSAFLVLFRSI